LNRGLGGAINNFVLHRPSEERMRMAHDGCRVGFARGLVFEQRFEPSGRTGDEQAFGFRNASGGFRSAGLWPDTVLP
jgi:hypothetical protein